MAQTEQAMDVHCHKEGEGEHWKRKSELERALQQRGRGGGLPAETERHWLRKRVK